MQMICSFFVDTVFLTTFGYWVVRGKGIRLPITMGLFYVVRALVQQVWVSPFPEGYYWEAPMLPSLVALTEEEAISFFLDIPVSWLSVLLNGTKLKCQR